MLFTLLYQHASVGCKELTFIIPYHLLLWSNVTSTENLGSTVPRVSSNGAELLAPRRGFYLVQIRNLVPGCISLGLCMDDNTVRITIGLHLLHPSLWNKSGHPWRVCMHMGSIVISVTTFMLNDKLPRALSAANVL